MRAQARIDAASSLARAAVLVVEADAPLGAAIGGHLQGEGYAVQHVRSANEALSELRGSVDLVLLSWQLPDMPGRDALARIRARLPEAVIVVCARAGSVDVAVEAMRGGAHNVLSEPCDLEALALSLGRALETTRLRRQVAAHRRTQRPITRLVGQSPAMREVKRLLERVALSPASTVLFTGETGTGKDLAARALHDHSERRDGPFLNITCSALPATLLESELFGHERGAFTDAKAPKRGLIEHADGGTLFLDEIGEAELALQSKLLRFLEERVFRRLGGSEDRRANVRVVAATNLDLPSAVRDGRFRGDLFYRLAVVPIHLPTLRGRRGDLELLANAFIHDLNRELKRQVRGLTPRALERLESHDWPGNVRELRNTIERAMLLGSASSAFLDVDDLPLPTPAAEASSWLELPSEGINLYELERSLLSQALERTGGNQVRAAALLGISRDQVRYRIEKHRLKGVGRRRASADPRAGR